MATFYQTPSTQQGLFADISFSQALSDLGDPLEVLQKYIDFETFRSTIESAFKQSKSGQSKASQAGRPRKDPLFMFKVLFLQRLYGLSDPQTQYMILDRISFQRFLGILDPDDVPDRNTIWLYHERFTELGLMQKLFDDFHKRLLEQQLICQKGKMIDASFVVAPKQRNTREENKMIKQGKGAELWEDQPNKKRQKTLMPGGRKRMGNLITAIKRTSKSMSDPSSLIWCRPPQPMSMTRK